MEQGIGDTGNTDTLTRITECLRATYEQHVIVGITGYSSLIRRLERCREILAEVHCEVSEILHHDGIVFRSELANHLQLLLSQTDPRGVVGIGIDDGTDVALLEIALKFRTEFISTIGIDIEGLILHAHHLQLHLLNREARVDKEHGILRLVALRTGEERGESALHRTTYGNTTFGFDVDADECLHELRGGLFEHRRTLNIGIAVGDTILQCLNLGIDSHLSSRQTRNAHLHLDELYPTRLLGLGCHLLHFADRGLGKILDTKLSYQAVNDFFLYWCFHYFLYYF